MDKIERDIAIVRLLTAKRELLIVMRMTADPEIRARLRAATVGITGAMYEIEHGPYPIQPARGAES